MEVLQAALALACRITLEHQLCLLSAHSTNSFPNKVRSVHGHYIGSYKECCMQH